jgi:hypothetical protein
MLQKSWLSPAFRRQSPSRLRRHYGRFGNIGNPVLARSRGEDASGDLWNVIAREESMNSLQRLLSFLLELDKRKIFYKLSRPREEAIMVEVAVPGERWEVEFNADGEVEVEVSESAGKIEAEEALARLFEEFSDEG